ncbi:hypothetical protein ACWD4V_13930 [Streptomyces tsukubensis]
MTTPNTPLHDSERDTGKWTPPLDIALSCARDALAKHALANVHSRDDMVRAAVSLDHVLRNLIAALDKEPNR